ncbi:DinB family protein [Pontibacter sp. G13]|uniref:DinB family protein n=1 Tax=Pontibacter sp. G13 TaxID=3074898 RepID=UPI0028894A1B|nr:DinB family protein [Pontibacter sp. G13]WNJ18417.1 DinB family protein [Pontibacter sp. G13]
MKHAAIGRLKGHIQDLPANLQSFTPESLQEPRVPGKWSRIQIVGHLVDSATRNLIRFQEVQFHPAPYRLTPYPQEDLVQANFYQEASKEDLLSLWAALNQQIVFVLEQLPEEALKWSMDIGEGEIKDMDFWIEDYVGHLEHHLQQIFE